MGTRSVSKTDESMPDREQKAQTLRDVNWFVRILIIIFVALLCIMVGFNFAVSTPPYQINVTAVTVLLIITVLILSESFNNLSIGKLLSISREVTKKEKENSELKGENRYLREQIVKVATTVNQAQVNATLNGVTPELLSRLLGVTPVTETEKKEIAAEREEIQEASSELRSDLEVKPAESAKRSPSIWSIMRYAEPETLSRYAAKYGLPEGVISRDVTFTPIFKGLDPIGERRVVFDGYIKLQEREYFFDIRPGYIDVAYYDKLYVMLSKIWYYRQAKSVQAELILLSVQFPPEVLEGRYRSSRRLDSVLRYFQPAVSNGLLRLETIELTAEDYVRFEGMAVASRNTAS